MPNYRPPSHNRLLALEQELLAKKRWAEERQGRQNINSLKREQAKKVSQKRHTNNRLLQLEQDILGKYHSQKSQNQTSQAHTLRVEKHNSDATPRYPKVYPLGHRQAQDKGLSRMYAHQDSDRIISRSNNQLLALQQELLGQQGKPKRQKPKSKGSRVKSQVFDTGEAIVLQYNSEVFPIPTLPTPVISLPEKTSIVDRLPIPDLPINREKSAILSVDNSPESPSLVETREIPKIETSTPELPIIPEKVVAKSKIPAEMDRETEDSLSQAAELISKIDTQPYPLQAEDIPLIVAELESDRSEANETPETAVTPPTKLESDRKNPHAIFDRMGKNMAYATTFDVGTIELEQLFDEFDDTLDREQSNLELERRFDEFDRTLDREENTKTATEQTVPTESLPEILSEQTDIKIEQESQPESEETDEITSEPETEEIHDQNQPSSIAPIPSHQAEWLQSLSYDPELEPDTSVKLDVKLEALLFRTGIGLISLMLRWLNLLRHQQLNIQPEIKSRSTLFPATYSDNTNNQEENPNSLIIDLNQNNSKEEISPFIFPIERSPFFTKSTPVNVSPPDRDSLTGMPNYEFIEQNSYPSINYPNQITADDKNNSHKSNLDRQPDDSTKAGRNDSS